MSLVSDAKTKIAKLLLNMQRFDQIMNGNETTDVSVDVGTVPTIRKLFAYIVNNVVGIAIKGTVNTVADLPTTNNKNGDIYIVALAGANNAAGDGYIWQATNNAWKNIGPLRGPVGPQGPQGPPGSASNVDFTGYIRRWLPPTDGSDAAASFVAACNAVLSASRGGTLFLPDGRYNFTTRPVINIPAGKRLVIVGGGAGATSFLFKNTAGLMFVYGSKYSSLTIYDMEIVTNRPNSGSAILLNNPTPEGNPAETAQSHFYNINIRGEVGENPNLGYVTTNYWTIGFNCQNVSNIHWNGGLIVGATQEGQTPTFPGGATVTMLGIGIAVTGSPSGQLYACAFNMVGTTFNYLEKGFVYGSWIQGVTCVSCNFTQCITGFYVADPAGSLLHGINITTSQFGCIGININVEGFCGAVTIEGNLIVPQPFQNGIRLNSTGFTIGGNAINGLFANGKLPDNRDTLEYGISITGNGGGTITGNSFGSLYGCVIIGSGVQLVNVGSNSRVACKNYVINNGSACSRSTEVALENIYNG